MTGKVRSRKDGSAVPLDDLDRKLLNLMQGQFPLQPRPYAAVAAKAEAITPVPGGVGPMTIAMLMRNTLVAAHRRAGLADPEGL